VTTAPYPTILRLPLAGAAALALTPWTAAGAERAAYVQAEISAANAGLTAELRAEKYTAMSADVFSFFRATNHLYWRDWGTAAQLATYGGTAQTRIWLQGDAHVENLGSFDNDDGAIVFDCNDFDEALIADYQLDVWRMATAIALVMRENGGFSASNEAAAIDAFSERYLDTLDAHDGSASETTRTFTETTTYGQLDDFLVAVEAERSRAELLARYTTVAGTRFLDPARSPDLAAVPPATVSAVKAAMPAYGLTLSGGLAYSSTYFAVKSVALRLHAGLGSLGATRYYVLIEGPSHSNSDDRILDIKAQKAPTAFLNVAAAAVSATQAASAATPARRVVAAARALGNHVDDHLGWMTLDGVGYTVRERSPWKDALDWTALSSQERIVKLAEQWGAVLATAHARADRDASATNVPHNFEHEVHLRTDTHHDQFRARVRAVAIPYADQVEHDYLVFLDTLAP